MRRVKGEKMSGQEDLMRRLESEDVEVLREAAFQAGDQRVVEAVPPLARLVQSTNLGVQEAADRALRQIGGHEVVQAVAPLLRSDDPPTRNIAMDVLREVGSQDFATLVQLMHDTDVDIRIFTADILGSTRNALAVTHLCDALLKDPEVNVRYQAAVSLGVVGRPEASACLGKAMNDDEWVQFAVIESLAKIRDESSVSALVGALTRATDLVASMIVDALGEMGNIKAVTLLIKRLDDSNPALRNKICKAVVKILGGKSLTLLSPKERQTLGDYLLAALSDEDTDIQDAAVYGLGYVGGDKATKAILDLANSLDPDRDQERLDLAINALAAIGMNDSLQKAVLPMDQVRAMVAVETLARIDGPQASKLLMEAFWKCDRDVQREIVRALVKIGKAEAVPFFLDILQRHEDGTVLKGALAFLGQKMRRTEAADAMFSLLAHPYDDVKEAALEACAALGGQDMIRRFRAMAREDDPLNRLMAVYALGKIDAEANIDELRHALEDEIPDIRKVALEAVAGLCGTHGQGLDLLVSRLSDESRDVRLSVVEQIGRCSLAEGSQYLMQALDDPDDWVRIRAMEALGARMDAQAVPKLVELLDSPNKLVALKAVETLGAMGGNTAFRALLDILNRDDHDLTAAAEEAIAKIQDEHGGES